MENIIEPKYTKVTFNFFKTDRCGSFKFCRPYKVKVDFIIQLVKMGEYERLLALGDFLRRGDKGASCEFYWQGDFYQARVITEDDIAKRAACSERGKKIQAARRNKKLELI